MKKIALAGFGILALTACGGGTDVPSTPAPSISGSYSGTLSYQGAILGRFQASLTQTNTPNSGDFNGTMTIPGYDVSTIVGNVPGGQMTITDPPSAINAGRAVCTGTWTNYTRYDGTCAVYTPSAGTTTGVTIALSKS